MFLNEPLEMGQKREFQPFLALIDAKNSVVSYPIDEELLLL